MKLTVERALPERPVTAEVNALAAFVNVDGAKVWQQLRAAANMLSRSSGTADTAGGGAYVTAWESDAMPTNATWRVTANVTGISISGTAQQASYLVTGTFISVAGAVSQLGATTSLSSHESAAACDARFAVDATARTVAVEVRDDAASPMRWTVVVETNEAQPA